MKFFLKTAIIVMTVATIFSYREIVRSEDRTCLSDESCTLPNFSCVDGDTGSICIFEGGSCGEEEGDIECVAGSACKEGLCIEQVGGGAAGDGAAAAGDGAAAGGGGSAGSPIDPESLRNSLIQQYGGPCTPPGCVSLTNPVNANNALEVFGGAIRVGMGILGAVTLLVVVYGGFMWLTSAGNAEQIKKGTMAITWAVLGIVVIFSSYAIIDLILKGLGVGYTAPVQQTTFCLIDNQCIPGGGGPCTGTEYEIREECVEQIKNCYCGFQNESRGNWEVRVEFNTQGECEQSRAGFPEFDTCEWTTEKTVRGAAVSQ